MTCKHQFENWQFFPDTCELVHDDNVIKLEPVIAKLLEYLLSNQGRLLTRDELIEHVWDNRIVSSEPINRGISIIRNTISPENKSAYIETVPKKGYRANFPAWSVETAGTNTINQSRISKKWLALFFVGLATVLLLTFQFTKPVTPTAMPPSIAVLPFTNLSQDDSSQYLGEGISDTVIHLLSQVNALNVTARTSSFSFRDSQLTIKQIAMHLGVKHILEGSIQVQEGKVRVLTRLIDANQDKQVWSESFDSELGNIFPIQDDIAKAVVASLKGTVLLKGEHLYQPAYEDFQLVIKGRSELDKMTTQGFINAEQYFRQAILSDPDYSLPYVLLARALRTKFDANSVVHIYPYADPTNMAKEVNQLIDKALELDPLLSEAHNLKALMLEWQGENVLARQQLELAISLSPSNADALGDYSQLLINEGELLSALQQARKATLLDPKSSRLQQILAQALWSSGQAEEAVAVVKDDMLQNPDSANNLSLLGRWYLQLGKPGQAMLYALKERSLDPSNPDRQWAVCLMHMQLWDYEQAEPCMTKVLDEHPEHYETLTWSADQNSTDFSLMEQQISRYPFNPYYRLQLADSYSRVDQKSKIFDALEPVFPKLFSNSPVVTDQSIWAAKLVAIYLLDNGETHQANQLINVALKHIERTRKMQRGGFSSGIDDVHLLILQGKHKEGISRLERAVDNHWSFYSMGFDTDPIFKPIKTSEKFQAIVERHKAFMHEQRSWYKEKLTAPF